MFRNRLSHRSTKAPRRRNPLAIEGLEDRTVLSASRTLGGLEFVTPGEFVTEGPTVRATGPVQVGIDQPGDAFTPLVQFTDGVSFTDGDPTGTFTGEGELIGIIGGQSIPLAGAASRTLSAAGLLNGIDLGGGKGINVAGANFNLSGIDLDGDAVKLQGSLGLPQLAGFNIDVEGDDYVVISPNGVSLTGLDATISDVSFQRAGFGFNLGEARVHYSTTDNRFAISGVGSILVAGREVGIRLGGDGVDGILIQNGRLTDVNATVIAPEIIVGGASLRPTGLTLEYSTEADTFAITGAADLAVGGATFGVELGDAEQGTKGLVLAGGQLQGLDMAVTADFAVGGITFTADRLRVAYTPADERFVLTGAAGASVLGNSVNVRFGGDGAEGIVIEDGRLTHLDAAINGKFVVGGMTIDAENLGMSYDAADERYAIFGGAFVTSPGGRVLDHVGARLGTGIDDPGLVIWQGQVQELDIGIDGKVTVGGMALEAKDLTLRYDVPTGKMQLVGGLGLSLAANRITAAATLTGDGFTFDPAGNAAVDGLRFEASADFKTVKVNNLVVEYSKVGRAARWAASGSVQLAPGVEVGGDFEIVGGKMTRIGLNYDAGTGLGIPIVNTGLYVTHVGGVIDNLNAPTDIRVAVKAEVTYGRTVRFMGKEYSLFRATGDIEVSKDDLKIVGDIRFCNGLMGAGKATVNLNWAEEKYDVGYDVLMYYGTFRQVGTLALDGQAISLDATATLQAPQAIKKELESFGLPTEFAGATFSLRIDPDRPADQNYAEAEFTTIGHTVTVRYDFNNTLNLAIFNGALKKLTKAVEAAGKAFTETYDAAGKLARRVTTEAGQVVTETMNAAGKVAVRVTQQAGETVTETFDRFGQLSSKVVDDGSKVVTTTYQFGVRVAEKTEQMVTHTYRIGYATMRVVYKQAVTTSFNWFGSVSRTVTETMNTAGQLLKRVTEEAYRRVTEEFKAGSRVAHKVVTETLDGSKRVTKKVTETFNSSGRVVRREIEQAGRKFVEEFDNAGRKIKSGFEEVGNKLNPMNW